MADVTILHNTACSTSKHALGEAEQTGTATEIVQYLKTPLDRAALLELISKSHSRRAGPASRRRTGAPARSLPQVEPSGPCPAGRSF
jgi:arsenate reductase-like glutaredoxin family protein